MPALYITEPGATVLLAGESLHVTARPAKGKNSKEVSLLEVALHRLELIGLVGRIHMTAPALEECLDHGIDVAYFRANGQFRARLVPAVPRSGDLRLFQSCAFHDANRRLQRARHVADAKVGNAVQVLIGVQSNRPNSPVLSTAIAELKEFRHLVRRAATLESLLGLEGASARSYFAGFQHGFKSEIDFPGRRRRPPPDPANALLSFGYVLLSNLLAGMIEARGLDPALGFYHEPRPGRPSLALDLLEEFRHPLVDRFVLRLCNLRILRHEHFEADDTKNAGGVRLTRDGLKLFFFHWEKHLLTQLRDAEGGNPIAVRPLLIRQIERLVADFRGKEAYRAFQFGEADG